MKRDVTDLLIANSSRHWLKKKPDNCRHYSKGYSEIGSLGIDTKPSFGEVKLTSLLENRKSLHQQVVDSQMQFEALDTRLQQLQPLATLGMAWAMTAHELNNLLTPIVSYAQLALQNPQDTELSAKALKKAERLSTQSSVSISKISLILSLLKSLPMHPKTSSSRADTLHVSV